MTPYDVMAPTTPARQLTKRDVLLRCREIEDDALKNTPTRMVALVQDQRFASDRARQVWRAVAAGGGEVTVLGRDLPAFVADGVPGRSLDDDDPLVDVWSVLVQWADGRAAGMAAIDVAVPPGVEGPDDARDFSYVETRDPDVIAGCMATLGGTTAH